jgi:hypothetical protein
MNSSNYDSMRLVFTINQITKLEEIYNTKWKRLYPNDSFETYIETVKKIKYDSIIPKQPPKMSEEMKNEIKFHPYHMFRNGDIVDFIPKSTREYFNL